MEQPCILLLTLQSSVAARSWPPQIGTLPIPLKFPMVQGRMNVLIQFHILRWVNRPHIPVLVVCTIIWNLDACQSASVQARMLTSIDRKFYAFIALDLPWSRILFRLHEDVNRSVFKYQTSILRGIIWIKWEKIGYFDVWDNYMHMISSNDICIIRQNLARLCWDG
jgi:hypothetical protein